MRSGIASDPRVARRAGRTRTAGQVRIIEVAIGYYSREPRLGHNRSGGPQSMQYTHSHQAARPYCSFETPWLSRTRPVGRPGAFLG